MLKSCFIADVHTAHITEMVRSALETCKTTVVLVPSSCTSLVQPLDVVVNRVFKQTVDRLQNEHMQQNLEQYFNISFSASQRHVLIIDWVGATWAEVCQNKEMLKHAFEKCGILVPTRAIANSRVGWVLARPIFAPEKTMPK